MPRGVHSNSLANLVQAPGGDRYAGKRMVLEAIETALAGVENGREIRKFFGLSAGRLLTQKHRARWAKVKAQVVYDAMVLAMASEVASRPSAEATKQSMLDSYEADLREEYAEDGFTGPEAEAEIAAELADYARYLDQWLQEPEARFGVLNIGGFVSIRTEKTKALYPVRVHKNGQMAPVSKESMEHAWFYFVGAQAGFGEYPAQVKRAGLWVLTGRWYPANGRGVFKFIARVKVPRGIKVQMYLEQSGVVKNIDVDLAPADVLVYIEDENSNYWVPYAQLSEYVPVTRFMTDWDDARATARTFDGDGFSYELPFFYLAGSMGTAQFDEAMAAKLDGWNYEFESLGEGMGGTPERVAEFFPRRQVVSGELDPVKGEMVYSAVKWLGWEEWQQRFGGDRGLWLAAGAIVPPVVSTDGRRQLAVTFDREFIDAIQPDAGG